MSPASERRASRRIAVQIHVIETVEDSTYYQHTANLSTGGLFLEGTMPHPPGTRVRLRFTLPHDAQPIEVTGEITAPGPGEGLGMGVHFTDLSAADRERIARFVRDAVAQPSGR